jgi:hypothetical protein
MRQQDERDLRVLLRDEAERHHPDRAAMLDRIALGRAVPSRPARFARLRPAGIAVAVAGLLVGGVGVQLADAGEERDTAPAARVTTPAHRTPAPRPPAAESPDPEEPEDEPATRAPDDDPPETSKPAGRPPTTRPPAATGPAAPGSTSGFLASAGARDKNSVDTWTQQNVTLKNAETITALDVIVNVALTDGVTEAGKWSTVPNNLLAMTVTRESDKLVYRFTLNQGATLTPGDYVFAAQFNHAGGRPLGGDGYAAAATADADQVTVSGSFVTG